jgi:hypothetical protein
MRVPVSWCLLTQVMALAGLGCGGGAVAGDAGADPDADPFVGTSELRVPVAETGRVYVSLATAAVVVPAGDHITSRDWDLAFEGYDVFTNSGPSGVGQGGSFGPLSTTVFLGDVAPEVPFISADETGGAFLDWYLYEGTAHVLHSRFHVYGIRNEQGTWKLQILTYYGERSGAPTSALYRIRYAGVGDDGAGAASELSIDGTAGGVQASETSPSGCIDFASGVVTMLSAAETQASTTWDVCFRRDTLSVNGEAGGPRGTGAVDFDAHETAAETLAAIQGRTADGERARFDAVGVSAFASASFRGDHVVSGFERGRWLDVTTSPPRPANAAWLVVDAGGQGKFLISFSSFDNPTTSSAGTIVMRIKPVSG